MYNHGFKAVHMNHDGRELGETIPENLEFSITWKEVGTCSYEMSTTHHMARRDRVEPYVTDFILYYHDFPVMGGMHVDLDRSDLESNALKVGGRDWMHYLEKRFWPFDPDEPNGFFEEGVDLAIIAQDLLDTILEEPHSLEFDYEFTPVGNITSYKIEIGDTQDIFRKFVDLSQFNPGFDFLGTWDKRILFAPEGALGVHSDLVLTEGFNVQDVKYQNQGIGATRLFGQGSGGATRIGKIAYDEAKAQRYRLLEDAVDFGDIHDEDAVQQKTDTEYARRSTPLEVIGCTFVDQEDNIFEKVSVGDWVRIQADVDWTPIDKEVRLVGLRGSADETGFVTVELTLDDGETPL